MAFIYIGFFILIVVVIVNISSSSQKQKTRPKPEPRRVTMDSIEATMKSQEVAMKKIEQLTETKLYKALTFAIETVPVTIQENPDYLKKYMDAFIEKQKEVMKNSIFSTPDLISILSKEQINYSIDEATKRVSKKASTLNK
ncbi:hypothetical protein [Algibacter luteus]|uniref:Uncharacterized protein n=1 Tax=Algibacter luteus TaxID=1178825 RepID=A0A1M6FFY9_9FLAO|nr:hypothetical protein [Algibacter luteus]SHI96553.1 hypothetical protein SAMN05216261_2373 [Algibacter luteus]